MTTRSEPTAETRELAPPRRDPVYLIVNERAGRGQGAHAGAQAREALEHRGVHVERLVTRGPGDATELARRAHAEGAAIVAAVGGDGTLHEVLNGLVTLPDDGDVRGGGASERPLLGAIPVGSGNDYVKMLDVSRADPRLAALSLLDGRPIAVDVGLLEGAGTRDSTGPARPELFLNNLGLAFAGAANARIESTRGLPGYLAYLVGAGIEFATYVPQTTEVEIDGRTIYKGRPTMVHINLGRYCGGGVIFTPDAVLDDGLFDVLVLGELTRLGSLVRWKSITNGGARTMEDVALVRGREVKVRGPAGELLHADGEVRRFIGGEVVARVVPKAISVIHA